MAYWPSLPWISVLHGWETFQRWSFETPRLVSMPPLYSQQLLVLQNSTRITAFYVLDSTVTTPSLGCLCLTSRSLMERKKRAKQIRCVCSVFGGCKGVRAAAQQRMKQGVDAKMIFILHFTKLADSKQNYTRNQVHSNEQHKQNQFDSRGIYRCGLNGRQTNS